MTEITFDDIKRVNDTIKTTNIKGKDYAEVNQRIKAFRMLYPQGSIYTQTIKNEEGICTIKAFIFEDAEAIVNENGTVSIKGTLLATGTAYEEEGSSFINKTSYIENCETSAVGRALGMAGFGIDTFVASYEEVANAIEQQENADVEKAKETLISAAKEKALRTSISNNNIPDQDVLDLLGRFGYENLKQIKMKDYMEIVKEFENLVKAKK